MRIYGKKIVIISFLKPLFQFLIPYSIFNYKNGIILQSL